MADVIELFGQLLRLFDSPPRGPSARPLELWGQICSEMDALKRGAPSASVFSHFNTRKSEITHLLEGWASAGYQTSFAMAKTQLIPLKNEIESFLSGRQEAA